MHSRLVYKNPKPKKNKNFKTATKYRLQYLQCDLWPKVTSPSGSGVSKRRQTLWRTPPFRKIHEKRNSWLLFHSLNFLKLNFGCHLSLSPHDRQSLHTELLLPQGEDHVAGGTAVLQHNSQAVLQEAELQFRRQF